MEGRREVDAGEAQGCDVAWGGYEEASKKGADLRRRLQSLYNPIHGLLCTHAYF